MDKVDTALERLRAASQMSLSHYKQPLVVTTSGGKDSSVCVALAQMAGIPFEVQHNHTTADAPETVYFVRSEFKRLTEAGIKCTINYPTYKGKRTSMWELIPQKLMPPTRMVRYCCSTLKEQGGGGRFITTGVRWAESPRRKATRGIWEKQAKSLDNRIILANDNDDRRLLFEHCRLKAKRACNPIVDWTDEDVWEFLKAENVPVNPLYCEGFDRVGCIGCPLATKHKRYEEFARWPKFKEMYVKAFDRMLKEREARGKIGSTWRMGTTGQDVFNWWMDEDILPGQIDIEDFLREIREEEQNE